ncbi:MAG: sigma-70 family RNA polymerase sigma factor [Firmicutes bacterium]|nr:sigma-70 family RNA polymerase sigma factor [Bacillota bacterium]
MMVNDSWYPETERLIARYWHTKGRIERLRAKEEALLADLKRLDLELQEIRRIPGLTAKYGVVPGHLRSGDSDYSALMEEYEQQVDKIAKKMLEMHRRLASIQHRIHELQEWIAPIEEVMNRLTPEERTLTEQRYVYYRSNYQVADILHCSEWRVRNMRHRIVRRIAEWLGKKSPRNFNALEAQNSDIMVS